MTRILISAFFILIFSHVQGQYKWAQGKSITRMVALKKVEYNLSQNVTESSIKNQMLSFSKNQDLQINLNLWQLMLKRWFLQAEEIWKNPIQVHQDN